MDAWDPRWLPLLPYPREVERKGFTERKSKEGETIFPTLLKERGERERERERDSPYGTHIHTYFSFLLFFFKLPYALKDSFPTYPSGRMHLSFF